MIGMPVADKDRVDLVGGHPFQQSRHRRITGIDKQPETIVLDEITAAREARLRPRSARAQNRQPHQRDTSRPSANPPPGWAPRARRGWHRLPW